MGELDDGEGDAPCPRTLHEVYRNSAQARKCVTVRKRSPLIWIFRRDFGAAVMEDVDVVGRGRAENEVHLLESRPPERSKVSRI